MPIFVLNVENEWASRIDKAPIPLIFHSNWRKKKKTQTQRLFHSDGNNVMKIDQKAQLNDQGGPTQDGEDEAPTEKWHLSWDLNDTKEPGG